MEEVFTMADQIIEILVVDDDPEIADLVEIYLTTAGYQVHKAYDPIIGLELLKKHDIKLALLDIMMPRMNGIDMCKRIRQEKNIPIIMLSAKTSDADKIRGLTSGADDYMVKPFNPMELIARVKSQLRRYIELNPGKPVEDDMIRVRNLVIDTKRHIVSIDDKPITLTRIEFNILQLLARHPGRVFSVDEIYENVWSDKFYEANNTVMVHIRRLREKIEDNPKKPKTIITVWGVGYKIEG